MEDYEYLWLLAGGDPEIDTTNNADPFVAQLVQSRTLFSHVPTDLDAVRAAMGAKLGGSSALDFDNDGDVDGKDLAEFAKIFQNVADLPNFAGVFGRVAYW